MKVKSWPKLIFSIILAQSAGAVGTLFTFSAIPTWYALLNKPSFSPPNWLFGPVWTILYTLIGISLYLIWTNKKGSLKLFLFHLFLNAIWSPIFFGAKNLGLAFFVILLMDITLILIIKSFYKVNKIAGIILVPYLLWIGFATLLNFSIWQLNNENTFLVSAQELTSNKARQDFIFAEDKYGESLTAFSLKRDSYLKNQTLSLKDEARIALFDFLPKRDEYLKAYLTAIRTKITELQSLNSDEKQALYSKIDPEVVYYRNQKADYLVTDSLEILINKAERVDQKYGEETLPAIYFGLGYISLGDAIDLKNNNTKIYLKLKSEAESLISLGRADSNLFDRWFKDIDLELVQMTKIEDATRKKLDEIYSKDSFQIKRTYEEAIAILTPIIENLTRLNQFVFELETTISEKR